MEKITTLKQTKGGKTGKKSIQLDKKALKTCGWFGRLLLAYREKVTERKDIQACLENHVNGVVHIPIRICGTLTSRNSSGKSE